MKKKKQQQALAAAITALVLGGGPAPGRAQPPQDIGDGWYRSTPADQGLDNRAVREILNRVRSQPDFRTVRGVVIVRHGTLVAEAYFGGYTNETPKNVHSVSKSVTSLAVGIAMDRGLLSGVHTPLADLLPHYAHRLTDPPRNRITLHHALTMTGGLAWNETAVTFWTHADSVDYVLTRDVAAEPGAEFLYSSGLSHVIAEVNNRASGLSHLAFVRKHLFRPLGITAASWDQDLNGRHWGGTGLRIRPRDMAKIGQLTLQEGLWEGRRLVSREWIAESTRGHTADIAGAPNYGYQWWIRPQGRFLAHGYNGQYIGVDPEADIVMTMITLSEQSPRPQETYRYYFEQLQDLAREATTPEERGRFAAAEAAPEGGSAPGELTVEVTRMGGSDGAATLAYGTRNGSARAGQQFRRTEGELRWEHGDASTRRVRIPLLPHAASGKVRDFHFEFESMSGGIKAPDRLRLELGPRGQTVNPAGSIEFTGVAFPGREGGEATIVVERRGGARGDVAVRYRTMPRSASAEADFRAVEGRFVWTDGESGARLVQVPLIADDEVERSELFDLVLSDVSGGAGLPEHRAVGVIQDMTAAPGCIDREGALCLSGGRFRFEVEWESHNGRRGSGALARLSDETGVATFFSPENVELVFKLLDGRTINGHHWVYYGALSDVEYWLIVTDTLHDRVVVYRNPPREICGRGDSGAFAELAGASALPNPAVAFAGGVETEGDCSPGTLCLLGGRFEVKAEWTGADGENGIATPLPGADATGYMWFFSPGNIELAVKALDGTSINNAFWIFAAGLTDVDYRLTVIDTAAGVSKTYSNPSRPFCGLGDTSAFPQ